MAGSTFDSNADTSGNSDGIAVAAGSGPHVKTTNYVELDASTSADSDGLLVEINNKDATDALLVDIASGAASSEVVLFENILIPEPRRVNESIVHLILPRSISSGTRISARCQASAASTVGCTISCRSMTDGAMLGGTFTDFDAIGVSTGTTKGTEIDPGATANTKGSWTQLVASSSNAYVGLLAVFDTTQVVALGNDNWLVDIGVGAISSEVAAVENILVTADQYTDIFTPMCTVWFPVDISASSRISARCQSTDNGAGTRELEIGVYGLVGTEDAGGGSGGGLKLAGRGGLAG